MIADFWKTIPLAEMSDQQWESLCDGCGRCCLQKLENDETGDVYYTSLSCQLLDTQSCQCSDYPNRKQKVPHCLKLTADDIPEFHWLPETCAYRLISEGKDLSVWHPLISGSADSVHKAGISVRHFARSENSVAEENWEDFIIPLTNIDSRKDHS